MAQQTAFGSRRRAGRRTASAKRSTESVGEGTHLQRCHRAESVRVRCHAHGGRRRHRRIEIGRWQDERSPRSLQHCATAILAIACRDVYPITALPHPTHAATCTNCIPGRSLLHACPHATCTFPDMIIHARLERDELFEVATATGRPRRVRTSALHDTRPRGRAGPAHRKMYPSATSLRISKSEIAAAGPSHCEAAKKCSDESVARLDRRHAPAGRLGLPGGTGASGPGSPLKTTRGGNPPPPSIGRGGLGAAHRQRHRSATPAGPRRGGRRGLGRRLSQNHGGNPTSIHRSGHTHNHSATRRTRRARAAQKRERD